MEIDVPLPAVLIHVRPMALDDIALAVRDEAAAGAVLARPEAGDSPGAMHTCSPSRRQSLTISRRHWRFWPPDATQVAISSTHARWQSFASEAA